MSAEREGPVFRRLLRKAGLSQSAFARVFGVTPQAVNRWCQGHRPPPHWASAVAVLWRFIPKEQRAVAGALVKVGIEEESKSAEPGGAG